MAQNLQQRLIAAKSPRARIADNEALLVDLQAEIERLGKARDSAAGESIDFALSDDDRDEAASKAARLDRTIKALEVEIDEVAAYTERRKGEDARKAKEAEKRAALTERDEIAARFADRVPAMMAELVALLGQVKANAERMRLAGVHEANAELVARGIPATGHIQMTPVMAFVEMKIPEWASHGRAWPIDEYNRATAMLANSYGEQILKGRKDAEKAAREKAEAAAKFAAEHGTYKLTVSSVGDVERVVRIPEELVTGNIPAALGCWDSRQLVIAHTVAEQLAKVEHLQVKRLDKGDAR